MIIPAMMVVEMVEATLETPQIDAERDQKGHVQIDKLRGGSVSLKPYQAAQVAVFILATNPMQDPETCQICGQQRDPKLPGNDDGG